MNRIRDRVDINPYGRHVAAVDTDHGGGHVTRCGFSVYVVHRSRDRCRRFPKDCDLREPLVIVRKCTAKKRGGVFNAGGAVVPAFAGNGLMTTWHGGFGCAAALDRLPLRRQAFLPPLPGRCTLFYSSATNRSLLPLELVRAGSETDTLKLTGSCKLNYLLFKWDRDPLYLIAYLTRSSERAFCLTRQQIRPLLIAVMVTSSDASPIRCPIRSTDRVLIWLILTQDGFGSFTVSNDNVSGNPALGS